MSASHGARSCTLECCENHDAKTSQHIQNEPLPIRRDKPGKESDSPLHDLMIQA